MARGGIDAKRTEAARGRFPLCRRRSTADTRIFRKDRHHSPSDAVGAIRSAWQSSMPSRGDLRERTQVDPK